MQMQLNHLRKWRAASGRKSDIENSFQNKRTALIYENFCLGVFLFSLYVYLCDRGLGGGGALLCFLYRN